MESSEAVEDNTVDTISGVTDNVNDPSNQTVRSNLDHRLSFSADNPSNVFSDSIESENTTDLIGSKDSYSYNVGYTNFDSTSCIVRLEDIPLPSDDHRTPAKNTEVLQSSLLNYSTDSEISRIDKMDVDEDDRKSNQGAIIVSEDSVSSVKDDCVLVESDATNSNIGVPDPQSDIVKETLECTQLENEMMETDENIGTLELVGNSDTTWESNSETDGKELVSDRTLTEIMDTGNEDMATVSDFDESVSEASGTPTETDAETSVKDTEETKSHLEEEKQSDTDEEQPEKECISTNIPETQIEETNPPTELIEPQTEVHQISNDATQMEIVQLEVKDPPNEVVEIQDDTDEVQELSEETLEAPEEVYDDIEETKEKPDESDIEEIPEDNVETEAKQSEENTTASTETEETVVEEEELEEIAAEANDADESADEEKEAEETATEAKEAEENENEVEETAVEVKAAEDTIIEAKEEQENVAELNRSVETAAEAKKAEETASEAKKEEIVAETMEAEETVTEVMEAEETVTEVMEAEETVAETKKAEETVVQTMEAEEKETPVYAMEAEETVFDVKKAEETVVEAMEAEEKETAVCAMDGEEKETAVCAMEAEEKETAVCAMEAEEKETAVCAMEAEEKETTVCAMEAEETVSDTKKAEPTVSGAIVADESAVESKEEEESVTEAEEAEESASEAKEMLESQFEDSLSDSHNGTKELIQESKESPSLLVGVESDKTLLDVDDVQLEETPVAVEVTQPESVEMQSESEENQIELEKPQTELEESRSENIETQSELKESATPLEEAQDESEDPIESKIDLTETNSEPSEIQTEEDVPVTVEETLTDAKEMQIEQENEDCRQNVSIEGIAETDECAAEIESMEAETAVIDTETESDERGIEVIDIDSTEQSRSDDVEMEKDTRRENESDSVCVIETENVKKVVEAESTSIGMDNLSTEPTSTSEEQIEELNSPGKNRDSEDQSVEQPSSTTETQFDEENLETTNELKESDDVPNESGADNCLTSVELEGNITSSKNAEKSSDALTESDDCTDQNIVNVVESAKESSEVATEDATESVMITSNVDQTINEEESESNPVFVHVDTETEKSTNGKNNESTLQDTQDEDFQESEPQEDPIASDDFAPVPMEDDVEDSEQQADDQLSYEQVDEGQGASEEMCIIPDTERVISQAEKDAAAGMVPLSDPTESEAFSSDPSNDGVSGETSAEKRKSSNPENYIISLCTDENVNTCLQCYLPRKSKYSVIHNKSTSYVCDDGCLNNFKRRHGDKVVISTEGDLRVKKLTSGVNSDNMIAKVKFRRKCSECQKKLTLTEMYLSWETMEFCNELCLSKYQKKVASNCSNCQIVVRNNCFGKYCVRFGYDIRQFCSSICLEEYKKGLKVCSYCQKDMSSGGGDGFLAPVGDKGQFKDFCTQLCMEKYDVMSNNRRQVYKPGTTCSVCLNEKPITIEFEHNSKINLFCGEPCFVAFKFVNNITPAKCNMCKKYFDNKVLEENSMFYDNALHSFCSKSCQNIYIIGHRKIVPCSWCKVKKYNFDMIKRSSTTGSSLLMCSLNCLSLYQVSINAVQSKKTKCDHCQKTLQPLYHLTMSDATMRNFCSYPCVMAFQNQFPKTPITLNEPEESSAPVPTGGPKRSKRAVSTKQPETAPPEVPTIPVISSVQSLATTNGPTAGTLRARANTNSESPVSTSPPIAKTQIKQHFIIKPVPIPPQRNIGTLCKVNMQTKGINCKPNTCNKEVQTDEIPEKTAIIPIPVPIYVPAPMWMYSMPFPVPFPFPLPVPVPIFIPTTRNSANGIMKEIKKIQVKIPTDPFEAELLMMAEMVAGDKKEEHTDSESEEEDTAPPPDEATFSPEPVDASNTFGDDMLQMALKMATELDEPAVDLEGALTANTITASQGAEPAGAVEEPPEEAPPIHHIMERQTTRGRKRPGRPPKTGGTVSKRGRRSSSQMEIPIMPPPQQPLPPPEPVEKPDANMCLKYTFGVNAWKQWVTTKNAELEKTSRRVKLFKPEILQLTADELNYSLCLFVKEVRKPNGQEYAPDTIYYLCLGIQQYLFENARIDNIFCDSYYEKFTDCLDEVAKKFSILYNDSHYIVTRVEEEHLWESKQLGAHSPHVLLSTLMFFNTKHFNLTTVDEHMQLSFSHIMKHWKRNSHNQPGTAKMAGSRNVLLRFYPPQTNSADASQRKKKVYEQQENEDNPLRCPVKLYEFYLSKCPESVKTRNDVFYLLPERSCVPDSPVWYSTMPLPRAALEKMLHRVKMVKEINVALLTS